METGNLADWFSAIGTVFSAIVALYLGLRKKRINVSYVINYNIILKKWTITVCNASLTPLNYDGWIIDAQGMKHRTGCGVEARKPYNGICPGGEIELLKNAPSMHLNLFLNERISLSKVKLQFIKKNKTEYLYRVYFSLMGRKILYRKIDEQKINLDNLSKVIN
ncbi:MULTISPECIES: hypothetical protein [Limosilactobacillus]|nr:MULTISPECIES: hypothetical protein [Limosilactobacillus]MCC4456013.1 hypothetical protein [Limosilactobacillus reuteri]MCC4459432.1 hypothetical protein [Limosilactobacillus reuteri]MCC4462436.1 hypothetical protein [Limosilactobacillus reuteri]MCC4464947.1 hypothetical protein [Limosilactobacillus reuteri]MCT3188563.1 hypothetical protein [Limosilactobacillus reuteri]